VTENSDTSSQNIKSEFKKINYDAVETSSKNLKVSRKSSRRSTFDSTRDHTVLPASHTVIHVWNDESSFL